MNFQTDKLADRYLLKNKHGIFLIEKIDLQGNQFIPSKNVSLYRCRVYYQHRNENHVAYKTYKFESRYYV